MKRYLVLVPLALLAACSSDEGQGDDAVPDTPPASVEPTTRTSDGPDELAADVRAYSDAFLTGDVATAKGLLSARCRESLGTAFDDAVAQAGGLYGSALSLDLTDVSASGDEATVTYTYDVSALDQTNEPWVNEDGGWRNDDC